MANPALAYEDPKAVSEYLLFHYGTRDQILPYEFGPVEALDFPVKAVKTFDLKSIPSSGRALDLGCAVGRSSFELSKHVTEAVGIDFSQAFIDAATTLQRVGELPYERVEEGEIRTPLIARVPEGVAIDRVSFLRGDAMELPDDLGTFQAVLLANLICRLAEPKRCLDRLPDLVESGGQLVITSPYTWMIDHTEPQHWLGTRTDEAPVFTITALTEYLSEFFELEEQVNLPFLIREHARKYQWSVAEATRWRRR